MSWLSDYFTFKQQEFAFFAEHPFVALGLMAVAIGITALGERITR